MTHTIDQLKPLTTQQYDECKARAVDRTQKRVGEKPHRKQFERELGRLWTSLDVLALVVFIPALIVSSVHIIAHMGSLAVKSYQANPQAAAGTIISQDAFVAAHQWLLIPLAEGSMILFLVMFGMTRGWRRWVYFALSLLAVGFVLIANWQSGIGFLESLLAPAFTIGIGFKLESLIMQSLKRRREVDDRYLQASAIYESATQDVTQHPDYPAILRQEVWQKLVSLKANQVFVDAPTGFKHLAVKREMARDQWAYEEGITPIDQFNPTGEEEKKQSDVPFGSTAPDLGLGGLESMKMRERVNGHGNASVIEVTK